MGKGNYRKGKGTNKREKEQINTFYATGCHPCADNSRNVNAKSDDLDFGKKNIIFALLRSGPAANAGLLRSFLVGQGHSAGVGEPSQAALGKNYKALGENYKADSSFYPPDSFSQAGLS